MNDRQKEVLLRELKNEEKLRKELLTVYKEAEKQVSEQITYLEAFGDLKSKIYQLKYQKYLKLQLDTIIDALKSKQYDKLNTYIDEAYRTRFIGTLYDIQGQGVPLLFPIDEGQVIDAVMINSKISKGLYDHLQEPFEKLKETIRREVARGIATGQSVPQIATLISKKMTGSYKKPMGQYAYATRIARTEAHRAAEQAADDVRRKAIDAGAEIVKEWCSILDLHTRDDHAALNGQIRDIDEPFEIKGQQAQFPGDFGIARQDINCRCICLQRAKWAIDEDNYSGNTENIADLDYLNFADFEKIVKDDEKLYIELSKYRKVNETKVSPKMLNSSKFNNLFFKLHEDKNVARLIRKEAKKILKHRSGTVFEDLVLIDIKTKKSFVSDKIDFFISSELGRGSGTNFTAAQLKKLQETKGKGIISLHNHPFNPFPSHIDLKTAMDNNLDFGLIVGSKGEICKYYFDEKADTYSLFNYQFQQKQFYSGGLSEKEFLIRCLDSGIHLEVYRYDI